MPTPPATLSRLTNRVTPADAPQISALLGLAIAVVVVATLSVAREVLIPITLAVLLSFVLGPVVALLRRMRVPRSLSVLLAAMAALGVVIVLGAVIGTQLAQLSEDLPRYASTIERKVSAIRNFATEKLAVVTNGMQHEEPPAAAPPPTGAPPQAGPMAVEVHQPPPGPLDLARDVLLPVISPLATAAIVFVVAVFILLQREDLRDRIIRLFGSNDLHRTTAALDDAGYRLGRYYLSLLLVNTAFGCVIGGALFLIGVPSPILWGIVAGLLRFIPYVGSFGGAVFPILLAASIDPGWTMVLETVAVFLAIEPILGQVVEPLVYGHSTGLSPVSVVISAIFWGWIWGPIGLLLSMPLTLCLVVLGKHIERLEFLDVLLGNRPALSPAESLYQRMLVGDADEALDQAETLLKERKLVEYYDEVAIPGLQLAANDSLRGVLTPEQLRGIMESICGVVVDLGEDVDPEAEPGLDPGWTSESAILCVAGRGPLDEAVCAMLAQVLGKRGLRARVVSHEAVARGQVASLDIEGVRLLLVSYIEGANSLSPLRYLVRRLRQRASGVTIAVGMWAQSEDASGADRVQSAIGADRYVASLRDAIALGVEMAQPVPARARETV